MTTLVDFQRALAAHIRHGAAVPSGLVADAPAFPAARRLAVYHDAYRLRLIDALCEDFPLLRRWQLGSVFRIFLKVWLFQCRCGGTACHVIGVS